MMKYFRKKDTPIANDVETEVWKCTSSECLGWMRVEFALEDQPTCPLCQAGMVQDVKMVPEISVTSV